MNASTFLNIVAAIERIVGGPLGAVIASLVGAIIRRETTITYTPEQSESFVSNELAAVAHRADDQRRANADPGPNPHEG